MINKLQKIIWSLFRNESELLAVRGEKAAAKEYKQMGFQIIAKNWRWKRNEVDLICRKDKLIAFVEVKSRSSVRFGLPQTFLKKEQKHRIKITAKTYIAKYGLHDCIYRFDLVEVLEENKDLKVNVIANAFQ